MLFPTVMIPNCFFVVVVVVVVVFFAGHFLIEFGMQFLFLSVFEVFQLQPQLYINFQHTIEYLYPDSGHTRDKRESKSA